MRQITLADLDRLPFSLHHVAAVDMVPRKPTFVSLPGGRPASCLFYIVSGACSFSWAGGEIRMEPGCLGYLAHRHQQLPDLRQEDRAEPLDRGH